MRQCVVHILFFGTASGYKALQLRLSLRGHYDLESRKAATQTEIGTEHLDCLAQRFEDISIFDSQAKPRPKDRMVLQIPECFVENIGLAAIDRAISPKIRHVLNPIAKGERGLCI